MSDDTTRFIEANRSVWDDWTAKGDSPAFFKLQRFRSGDEVLQPLARRQREQRLRAVFVGAGHEHAQHVLVGGQDVQRTGRVVVGVVSETDLALKASAYEVASWPVDGSPSPGATTR